MRAEKASIAAWLEQLAADRLVERSARTALDVERLLGLQEKWSPEALGQSLASLLANDEESYRKVLEHFRQHFRLTLGPQARPGSGGQARTEVGRNEDPGAAEAKRGGRIQPEPRLWPAARPLERLRDLAWRLPGVAWAVIAAVIAIAVIWALPRAIRATVIAAVSALPGRPALDTKESDSPIVSFESALSPVTGASLKATLKPAPPDASAPPGPLWLSVLLGAASMVLGVMGARFLFAERAYSEDLKEAMKRSEDERSALMGETSMLGVPYNIERAPPLPQGDIDDSATLLGRIVRHEEGQDLDIASTIDRTIDAGGRVVPVFSPGGRREALLIFVDVEGGSHPYLDGVEWVLERWKRIGLPFIRYDYSDRPINLFRRPDGQPIGLDELGRRAEGMPLLVFSRMALPQDYRGRLDWLRHLDPWPNRAWIDLDPRTRGERRKEAQRVLDRITYARLPRYPFTRYGLAACAAALSGGGRKLRSPRERELRKIDEVEEALRRWAAVASCVPDPDWVHIDSLRRSLSDLSSALPDPRYVQRLIDWVREKGYAEGTPGSGSALRFRAEARVELIAWLRRSDTERFPEERKGERLEHQARMLLIRQLRVASVHGDAFEEQKRDVKMAVHEAVMSPAKAERLIAMFADKGVAPELRDLLDEELRVQEVARAAIGGDVNGGTEEGTRRGEPPRAGAQTAWSAVTREAARVLVDGDTGGRARLRDLLRLRGWSAAHAAAVAIALAAGAASWGGWWLWAQRQKAPQAQWLITPATYKVIEQERPAPGETDQVALAGEAPMQFIQIPGGIFQMGSPEEESGRYENETLHEAKVETFEIAVHEVTQKQWMLVMRTRPFDCSVGCGDELPAQNVSWSDAVEFMNALTDRENKARPAGGALLTRCYDGSEWFNHRCTGYRLPTEIEWEYAARAGTQTAYSFGDSAKQLCAYGNGIDPSTKNSPTLITSDCEDGYAYLAPVGRFIANGWGLYDVHGNVWEWVWDWYGAYPERTEVGYAGPKWGDYRVLRGGAFNNPTWLLRSSMRLSTEPSSKGGSRGFRCARGMPHL